MRSHLLWFCCLLALSTQSAGAAEVHTVHAGDDLQAALNEAEPGDELRLEAGAVFRGSFVLPAKIGDGTITVRTDLSDASLPPDGVRVTPEAATRFAKLESLSSEATLKTAPGAHDWRLLGLEFRANKDGYGDILLLGDGTSAQSSLDRVPHDILIDRVYIHGDPRAGQKRGIALNAKAVTIRNSYISDIAAEGFDAQAIAGWNGPGPFLIENNYLEASGEVFLLGGADPAIPDLVPSDVVVRYNHVTRPMTWRGSRWQIKNLLELKNARRVRIEYNVFENNWLEAQPGYAILFTPRNQDGKCPWCVVELVEFSHNIVRNTSAGMNILGFDSPNVSRQTNAIRVEDNLFSGITKTLGGNGWAVLIGDEPRDITFERNTFDFDGTTLLYAYGGDQVRGRPIAGFHFTNNAGRKGQYGINGADASPGKLTMERYFPGATFSGNVLKDDLDVNAVTGAGADVKRLLRMADAVTKGVRPTLSAQ
jgi:hypothetical protein